VAYAALTSSAAGVPMSRGFLGGEEVAELVEFIAIDPARALRVLVERRVTEHARPAQPLLGRLRQDAVPQRFARAFGAGGDKEGELFERHLRVTLPGSVRRGRACRRPRA